MPENPLLLKSPVAHDVHARACAYRLRRVHEQLVAKQCDAILLYDPVNIRYATDTSNMQVWTLHNRFRYALIVAEGPVTLWEFKNCEHLHSGNPQIDETRVAINWTFFATGARVGEKAAQWATDLVSVLKRHTGASPQLAVDTADNAGIQALGQCGIRIREGEPLMEEARKIKCAEELEMMRWTMHVCEVGIERMYTELTPGMTEQELWAWLHFENIRNGGEWIETRLLASGPRTNPWMQEASNRKMQQGELVCFDTDLIGPYGYCADVSRAWTVGHVAPTSRQKSLYQYAYEQIHVNAENLRPGISHREISEGAWPIPAQFYDNRYSFVLHGVGMGDEFPGIPHWGHDWEKTGNDGVLEENMVVSIESYVGEVGGTEGVKLEQQYLIGSDGAKAFSRSPWNDDWL